MSQVQTVIYTSQPSQYSLPIDPMPLLENGDSPTSMILAIAILTRSVALLVQAFLPAILQKKSNSSKK